MKLSLARAQVKGPEGYTDVKTVKSSSSIPLPDLLPDLDKLDEQEIVQWGRANVLGSLAMCLRRSPHLCLSQEQLIDDPSCESRMGVGGVTASAVEANKCSVLSVWRRFTGLRGCRLMYYGKGFMEAV